MRFYKVEPPPVDEARFDREATAWIASLLIEKPQNRSELGAIIPSLTPNGPLLRELHQRVSRLGRQEPDERRLVEVARESRRHAQDGP
jgi:hypothetical protein